MKTTKIVSIEDAGERYGLKVDGDLNGRYSGDNAGFNVCLMDAIKLAFSLRFDYGHDNVKIVFKGTAAERFAPNSIGVEELSMGIENAEFKDNG